MLAKLHYKLTHMRRFQRPKFSSSTAGSEIIPYLPIYYLGYLV
jgi:hypothetical protein